VVKKEAVAEQKEKIDSDSVACNVKMLECLVHLRLRVFIRERLPESR
jgi:hypothetical protein